MWGILQRAARSRRSHPALLRDAQLSRTPGWVLRRSQRDGSSKAGPVPPSPRGTRLQWQQPGRFNTAAVSWQGHSGWDLPGGRLILGALRRGYFGPFALYESPVIFQPHWGYFRGRHFGRLGQCCCCCLPGDLEPKTMLGALNLPAATMWCQRCPEQGGPVWTLSHLPDTTLEDCMVGLGAALSSSSSASQERWMGRGWK